MMKFSAYPAYEKREISKICGTLPPVDIDKP